MRWSLALGGGLLGSLLSLSPGARASELSWSAPEGCLQDVFVQQVEDNLQVPLAQVASGTLRVRVAQSSRSEWSLEFSLSEAEGVASASRKLIGASCEDVSRAGAVAVAMALHAVAPPPEAAASLPDEAAPPPEAEASLRDVTSPQAPSSAVPSPEREGSPLRGPLSLRGSLSLVLLGDLSLLGTASYGVGGGLGVGLGRWEVMLSGAVLPSVELRISDALGVTLGAVLGQLSGCFTLGGPPAVPRACLGYELGVVEGEGSGTGLLVRREQRALWHALRPELGLGVPLGSELELRLFAGAALGLSRARFVLDEGRVAHEIPRVSARGAVGLAWTP